MIDAPGMTEEIDEKLLDICVEYDVDLQDIRRPNGTLNVREARGAAAQTMVDGGMTHAQIAAFLGRTEPAVVALLAMYGLKPKENKSAEGDNDESLAFVRSLRKHHPTSDPFAGLNGEEEEEGPQPENGEAMPALPLSADQRLALSELFWTLDAIRSPLQSERNNQELRRCQLIVWELLGLPAVTDKPR